MIEINDTNIAVIGLGYVGLPLAVEFGKIFKTIGFDINESRIGELVKGFDSTRELEPEDMEASTFLKFSVDMEDLQDCNIFIVTVPTPIDKNNTPDLGPLVKASEAIAKFLKQDDIVIYESTVYPGATEEVCVPVLENQSGLEFNKNFFCGYSPERINPGDKEHSVTTIKKVTSGSNSEIANKVDALYSMIVKAGTHKAASIKIAEAAKVIENTQRDINIALINELAVIFNKLDIDTEAVLEAAGTKWNFLPFRPGLVGGHCIGVDPYYLAHKCAEVGYHPELILAGRRLNASMGSYIAGQVVRLMLKKKIQVNQSKVLIMGLAFKENCPDIRNTRVIDVVTELKSYGSDVDVHDPHVDKDQVLAEYDIELTDTIENIKYDAIVLAVAHSQFKKLSKENFDSYGKDPYVLYDIKYLLESDQVDGRL
tara:strand:- start:51 stop:1328 length:1278 start_codon:yes stop_codon:yes gene_type:complete